ncbi:MAG: putative toxin-antitoxin system toxin component, PIN family [Thermoanaerobaculia bacterium]|nr:putative toxin-antitoxin system toxin component, PIN family [Thermoanaerobaculia bacterium]
MGAPPAALTPVVFDTGVVLSALLFRQGPAAALRTIWAARTVDCLVSHATLHELVRVLHYPKFALGPLEIELLLGEYVPHTRLVSARPPRTARLPRCRDRDDQKFLELAAAGRARSLVTGDLDLLALKDKTAFEIVSIAEYLAARPA